jgi:hypothetical protein
MAICAYCNKQPAIHTDHLITKNQARRNLAAARAREQTRFKVPSCGDCNWRKGVRLFVPASHADFVVELEAITHGTYRVWDGDPAALREVVK